MTFPFPIFAPGDKPAVTFSHTDSPVDATDASSYTFSGASIGTASATRKVVVAVKGISGGSGHTVSSMTIAGVSASLVVGVTATNNENRVEIWQAAVPTGTTGDIVVNWAGTNNCCGIGVYAVYNAASAAFATNSAASDAPISTTVNVPAKGVCIAVVGQGATSTSSWTGLTERYDEVTESPQTHHGGADAFAAAQSPLSISVALSAAGAAALVAASWGQA